MNTDQLIERLVAEARPIRRLVDPSRRAALWVAIALVCVTFGVLHFGLRRDVGIAFQSLAFWLRIALLVSTMWLAVTMAFRLAVPGRDTRVWRRWWPMIALGALVALTAGDVVTSGLAGDALGSPLRGWTCLRKVAFVGAVPAALALFLIHRTTPIEPQWAALLGILAAGAAGALTAEIACPIKSPLHILLWHAMPVVASIAVGLVAGSALLWWMRKDR